MGKAIRNNKAYDSADVEVTINGILTDAVEINYNTTQEHQKNYTLKSKATSWSRGKIDDTCSLTLMVQDVDFIEKTAPDKFLPNIKPFYINVTFVNEYNDIINDTILAKFQDQGRDVTGDMGLNKQYDLFVLDINYNNA